MLMLMLMLMQRVGEAARATVTILRNWLSMSEYVHHLLYPQRVCVCIAAQRRGIWYCIPSHTHTHELGMR